MTWFFDSDLTEGVNFLDSFLARYFGLLFDRWVGGDYELGLSNLKQYAESLPVSDFSQLEIERVNVTHRISCSLHPAVARIRPTSPWPWRQLMRKSVSS